ncbi:MAG: ATP-dependent sacrificial sulfur transferase LarE [Gemmatimonadota bacterium]
MIALQSLHDHLAALDGAVLGYSGGVDSALLAVVACRALGRDRFVAVIGRSASYPAVQHAAALALATRFDVPVCEVDTHEMEDERYLANPVDRCYFCKHELWTRLGEIAVARGIGIILDGTNADDLGEHRPGLRAAAELRVRSPLAELGWTKAMVREASRALDLPTSDAPAAPCLSSRVRYGLAITPARLAQVERGEAFLRALGVRGDLRVRHLGASARIEVLVAEMPTLQSEWAAVREHFAALGFAAVDLDPRGYRRGSLLVLESGAA